MKETRDAALDIIMEVLERGAYLSGGRSGYVGRVCRGVVERAIELDSRINTISSMKIKRMHPVVRNVLRLGAYEILYMDSIPVAATVNEMVALAKKRGQKRASGLVNACLRKVEGTTCDKPPQMFSMPDWLYNKIKIQYKDEVNDICEAFLSEQPLTLRINTSAVSVYDWEDLLYDKDISYSLVTENVYSLWNYESIEDIPGYKEGFWYIQNPSSTMTPSMAEIAKGMRVLDMCAAPGGKSIHAADLCGKDGFVLSRDVSGEKVKKINENILRTPFSNIKAQVWDACVFDEKSVESFDVVIADVPCSGVGVIGRKPEIKYRLKEEDIQKLAEVQSKILSNASKYVKKNGRLAYSTCTLFGEENEMQIQRFLEGTDEFRVVKEKKIIPHDNWDGFYICVMEKIV